MLPGFEVIAASSVGGSFIGAPTRLVLHTTEGDTVDGAVGAYRATGSWPHFTVDPKRRRRVQHYELGVSARALLHRPGDPETNRCGAIQIEICGFAAQTPAWPVDWLDWLRDQVVEPIRAAKPFALTAAHFVAHPASYGFGASQRMSWGDWAGFNGICGHQHVPGNDHGDPGALDVNRLLLAPAPTPPPEDYDMLAPATAFNAETGEQLGFETRTDGQVWVRNIEADDNWTALSMLEVDGKTTLKAASAPSAYFRPGNVVIVVVRDSAGVAWRAGAHPADPAKPRENRVWDRWYTLGGGK